MSIVPPAPLNDVEPEPERIVPLAVACSVPPSKFITALVELRVTPEPFTYASPPVRLNTELVPPSLTAPLVSTPPLDTVSALLLDATL